ncbi:MAG: LCP family protein [Actinobacteria bacterium]|nr:LCP family protein [Actinomycetota bacterium]
MNSLNKTINSLNTAEVENILTPIESPEEPVTILLLGRDTRDAENEMGRSDTIMLLYMDPGKSTGSLLSIPRDTLVDIPGYGEDKINAAYSYGGEELMIKTIKDFIGADINHYITLDFQGFIELIDAVGGLDIVIDRPLIDPKSGASFSPGNHHLTGEQALAYTRSRSTELGDIGRIQRQQHLFREFIKQKLNMKYLSNVPYYFNILVENTRTDLDILTILKYSKAALSLNSDNFGTAIIPSHSDWIEDGTISVQIPDTEEAKMMWERILEGQPASRYGAVYTDLDGSVENMASNVKYHLRITVKNTSLEKWESGSENPVLLGYHWIDFEDKKMVVFDGNRAILPRNEVAPGEEVTFVLEVEAPGEPGQYILQVDMVKEGVTWFSYQGVPPMEKYVVVDLAYSVKYDDFGTTPNKVETDERFPVTIWFKNTGTLTWSNDKDLQICLGYHWLDRDTREPLIWDNGRRLHLQEDMEPGEEYEEDIIIFAPEEPGRYILQYDLVHEGVTWFSTAGITPFEIDVNVGKVIDKTITTKTHLIISNGNGIAGSAARYRDYLKVYGFKVAGLKNADSFDYEKTVICYIEGQLEKAQQLEVLFDSYELKEIPSIEFKEAYGKDVEIVIIAGKDYLENLD